MRARLLRFQAVLIVSLGGAVACSDAVGVEDAATPSQISVKGQALRATVEALADDSMCGRLVGTVYEQRAAAYIADRFVRAGLQAGGTDGYLQPLSYEPLPREAPPTTDRCAFESAVTTQNVIGMLPGAGALAGQWVILGAHYDHIGWDEQDGLTRVYNGADDNASGVAVVLEAARLLAAWVAVHPEADMARRSVMFHAYGAEEIGLVGSRVFATTPTVPGDSLYAMLNLDMVGWMREGLLTIGGGQTSSAWNGLLAAARPDGVQYAFDDGVLQRSDQWSFISIAGVPALHLFTGLHQEYHTPADDPPLLNYDGMARVTRLALALLWELATRPASM